MIYADTSFLVAIYLPEEGSKRVVKWMESARVSLPFTPLHRHEFRTGARQRVFRREMTAEKLKEAFAEMELDLDQDILRHQPIPWTDAFREAERFSISRGTELALRSLDLLHVGIALALKAEHFLTLDSRQEAVAQEAGLKVGF